MFNKPIKPMSRSAQPNRIGRLIVFLSLVTLVMFWLFPKTSMFISLILIVFVASLIGNRVLLRQTPPDPENPQQDDQQA